VAKKVKGKVECKDRQEGLHNEVCGASGLRLNISCHVGQRLASQEQPMNEVEMGTSVITTSSEE